MDLQLQHRLEKVAARVIAMRLAWRLMALWLVLAIIGIGCWWLIRSQSWQTGPLTALALGCVAFAMASWFGLRALLMRRDLQAVAQKIEKRFPNLGERLLAAMEQRPASPDGKFGYLQQRLIESTVQHDDQNGWLRAVPGAGLKWAWIVNLPAIVALLAVIGSLATLNKQQQAEQAAAASAARGNELLEPVVEPGDTEVEIGSSFIVTAKFAGRVPQQVALLRSDASAQAVMRRSLDDPLFASYLSEVRAPLTYAVRYEDRETRKYQVKVFEYPALVRADAEIVYPSYTQLEAKTVVDTRRVSAVVGSELTWLCYVNKALASAKLVDENDNELRLEADASNPQLLKAKLKVEQSRTWQLRLFDEAGRANKLEVKLSLKALPNAPPKLKLASGECGSHRWKSLSWPPRPTMTLVSNALA